MLKKEHTFSRVLNQFMDHFAFLGMLVFSLKDDSLEENAFLLKSLSSLVRSQLVLKFRLHVQLHNSSKYNFSIDSLHGELQIQYSIMYRLSQASVCAMYLSAMEHHTTSLKLTPWELHQNIGYVIKWASYINQGSKGLEVLEWDLKYNSFCPRLGEELELHLRLFHSFFILKLLKDICTAVGLN
ncbi:Keratin, Type Ii Cytoskeletal 4 [Manis pentadactyla]|nr:Keratin, Type Ii Cytoskeletal 4 [Manis pentadactyla]